MGKKVVDRRRDIAKKAIFFIIVLSFIGALNGSISFAVWDDDGPYIHPDPITEKVVIGSGSEFAYPLYVRNDVNTQNYATYVDRVPTNPSQTSGALVGIMRPVISSTNSQTMYGVLGYGRVVPNNGISYTGTAIGLYGLGQNYGQGTANVLEGVRGFVGDTTGSGAITTGRALRADCNAATTCYGLYVSADDPAVTTAWGVYSTGEDKNYFSGDVGIGDTTPDGKLHVVDNNVLFRLESTGGTDSTQEFYASGNAKAIMGWDSSLDQFAISHSETGATLADAHFVVEEGDIGIGESAPITKLHVRMGDSGVGSIASGHSILAEEAGSGGITIGNPNNAFGQLDFRDPQGSTGKVEYYHGDDSMRLYTGGTEKVRIDSAGDVGIGVTDPVQKLQVNGNIEIPDAWSYHFGGNAARITGGSSTNFVQIITNSQVALAVKDGDVGIGGIDSPLGDVHIRPTAPTGATHDASFDNVIVETTADTGITLNSGSSNRAGIVMGDGSSNNLAAIMQWNPDSYGERLLVGAQQAGGTTQFLAGSAFQVMVLNASSDKRAIISTPANVDGNAVVAIDAGTTTQKIAAVDFLDRGATEWGIGKDTSNNFFISEFGVNNHVIIEEGGDIGINTPIPTAKLHITTGIDIGQIISSSATRSGLRLQETNGASSFVDLNNENSAFTIDFSDTEHFRITASGDVGIGTTNPTGALHVNDAGWVDQTASPDSLTLPGDNAGGLILDGPIYNDGRYRTRLAKVDRGGNIALYIQETRGVGFENDYNNLARFGTHNQDSTGAEFRVFGDAEADQFCLVGDSCISTWPSGGGGGIWSQSGSVAYYNDGSVGIGTDTPNSKLEVVGGNIDISGHSSPGIRLFPLVGHGYVVGANDAIEGAGFWDIDHAFWRFFIEDSTGDIGIGNFNPNVKLHIDNNSDTNTIVAIDSGLTSSYYSSIDFRDQGSDEWGIGKDASNNFYIAETGVDNHLIIEPGGQVGIGTPTPSQQLTIRTGSGHGLLITGTDASRKGININPQAGQQAAIDFLDGGTSKWVLGKQTNNVFFFWDSENTRDVMRFLANSDITLAPIAGNVVVGSQTVDPSVKFEVVGGPIKATDGFIVETRSTDPASPVEGQMWLIT